LIRSPVDCKGVMVSKFLEDMRNKGYMEVKRWDFTVSDETIINEIENNRELMLYVMSQDGVPLYTHAGCKSFFSNILQQSRLNPSYNTKGKAKKHLPNQKDSA